MTAVITVVAWVLGLAVLGAGAGWFGSWLYDKAHPRRSRDRYKRIYEKACDDIDARLEELLVPLHQRHAAGDVVDWRVAAWLTLEAATSARLYEFGNGLPPKEWAATHVRAGEAVSA